MLRHYFTDEKVLETLALCEAHGLNTAILRVDSNTLRILDQHRQQGGKLQWIAQVVIKDDDFSEIGQAIDHGAVGVFTHGGVGDSLVEQNKVEVLGKAIDLIRKKGAVAGVAGHALEVVKACEQAKLAPDFYMKTFNSKRYWSAGPVPRHDSVFEETPEETKAFMEQVDRPWVAYKVLGAGAIHPVARLPVRLPKRRGFHLRRHVRLPGRGRRDLGPGSRWEIPFSPPSVARLSG